MRLHLYIGNKAYSSWSLRPWILLTHFGIPFTETVIPMYQPTTPVEMLRHGPGGKVPVLHADDLIIWETLAICEFVAEAFPDLAIWPVDRGARAMARSLSAEMHAGFTRLRQSCPTNFRRDPKPVTLDSEARADVDRIEAAWAAARSEFGGAEPFLFGAFTAADAMFAPVVNRFHAYGIDVGPQTRAYMDAVMTLPAWRKWIEGGKSESYVNADYERI